MIFFRRRTLQGAPPNSETNIHQHNSRRRFLTQLGSLTAITIGAGTVKASDAKRAEVLSLPEVSSVASDTESFKEYVTRKLGELDTVTGPEGDIQRGLNALRERFNELSAKLDKCDQMVGDYNDVAAVQKTLCEISKALNIPCP